MGDREVSEQVAGVRLHVIEFEPEACREHGDDAADGIAESQSVLERHCAISLGESVSARAEHKGDMEPARLVQPK